jgi:hypothetical protein
MPMIGCPFLQAIVDENARNLEDDPRLDPSEFLSGIDMDQLRAQVERKLQEKEREAETSNSKSQEERAGDGQSSTPSKGFGPGSSSMTNGQKRRKGRGQ